MTTAKATAPLLDPLAALADQNSAYDWAGHDTLHLSDRYRQRQLPLLDERTRRGPAPDPGPGEFWPPVRSTVVPLDAHTLGNDRQMTGFLDDLRATGLGDLVWWRGLDLRADRIHATLAVTENDPEVPPGGDVCVVVRGPWIGRLNAGRIYLPVQAADQQSADHLADIRTRAGQTEHRPLLAGYLQFTDDVGGEHYRALHELIATYQTRIAVAMGVRELWVMETMDDLVLRSRVAARLPVSTFVR